MEVIKMRKKAYNLTLPEESAEIVRSWLQASGGQTLSSWVSGLVEEFAKEIQGQPSPLGKSPGDMTLKEFVDVMQYWYKKASES
jgi:hypothetical protein